MLNRSGLGQLIVFEGPDGVGKSTLSQALAKTLTAIGIPCEYLTFPGKEVGTIGRLVYDLHHDPDAFGLGEFSAACLQALHIAAHLDTIERRIVPALSEGRWVILDRFWWSTWVYGCVSAIPQSILDAMIQVERLQWNGIKPATLFLIDRSEGGSKSERRARLRQGYRALFETESTCYPVCLIKNDESVEQSLNQLLTTLRDLIPLAWDEVLTGQAAFYQEQVEQLPLLPCEKAPSVLTTLTPARPSVVYESYWQFAAERQEVFFRKMDGLLPPWTTDPILARYKFTNAYRASDRVSQYLIRQVIYTGDQSAEELFFRIILFKLFNKIETWEMLEEHLGTVTYADYSFAKYDKILSEARSSGATIYSGAYIMPSGRTSFGYPQKHRNHLKLLERMMEDKAPRRIVAASGIRQAFDVLRSYPTVGSFLAYQFATDINYSNLTNFSEMEFVVPGPGALDGIRKCFTDLGGMSEVDIIRLVTERQEQEFERLALKFRTLGGRNLQLIDCQNLFCEVSKYARVKYPSVKGINNRKRIKQLYRPSEKPIAYWYPPKWGINDLIPGSGSTE